MASMINPGTSINFDAKALEEQDEQEQQKEDLKREQELRDLLTNELPDDLLDDCSSLSSRDSSGFESPTTKNSRNQIWQQFGWHHQQPLTQTSTPLDSVVPSLKTPAPMRDYRLHQADTPDHYEESDTESGDLSRPVQNGYHDNHFPSNYGHHNGQPQEYVDEPQVGGDQPDFHHQFHYRPPQEPETHTNNNNGGDFPRGHANGFHHPKWSDEDGKNVDTWVKHGQYYESHNQQHVQYQRQETNENYQQHFVHHHGQDHSENGDVHSAKEDEIRLQNFTHQGGNNETRHLGQLQILYKARGRELEELRLKLKQVTEEGERATRVLNHQLALADGEKSRLNLDLKLSKEQLQKCVLDCNNLKMTMKTYEDNIQELTSSKQQLADKLEEMTANNEALNHQLIQLNQSQTIARSRDNFDTRLAELQRRQQQDVYEFETKIDKLNAVLREKEIELSSQKEDLAQLKRDQNREKLEMTETVSSLTRKLDESQRQCRDLLDTGSVQEIGQLKLQLQQSLSSKTITENMCQALQDELGDVKEELRMYEAAAGLGVGLSKSPNGKVNHTDSYIHLGVRNLAKEDWKTPKLFQPSKGLPTDDLVSGLKTELERSLTSNRSKRGQVTRLQNELKGANDDLEKIKKNMADLETELKDKEVKLRILESQDKSSASEGHHIQAESLRSELIQSKERCASLEEENKEMKMSLNELQKKEEELLKKNVELKNQMSEMIAQHDEDSKVAIERCRATVLQLHEDSSKNLRNEMVREWEDEKATLEEAYQHRLQQLREENDRIMKELDDVKNLYVKVCEEKNNIEDTVKSRMKENAQKQLEQTIEELEKQNQKNLDALKSTLENQNRVALATARKKIMEDRDEEIEKLVNDKVSFAKAEWMVTAQQQARETATKAAEAEWEAKLDAEVTRKLEDQVYQVKKELMEEYEQKLTQERDCLKTTHTVEIDSAVKTALSQAQSEWQLKQAAELKESLQKERENILEDQMVKTKIEAAVNAAKEEWIQEAEKHSRDLADNSRRLSQLQSSWKREMDILEKTKDQEKQDAMEKLRKDNEDSLRTMLEEQKSVLTEALKSARDAFDNEKTKILKQKDLEQSIAEAKFKTKLLEEWSTTKQDTIQEKIKEEQIRWQKEKQELEEMYTKKISAIEKEKDIVIQKQKELLEDAKSELHKKCDSDSKKADHMQDTWEEEKNHLLLKLEEADEAKQKLEEKVDSYKRKFTREYNRLIEKTQMERQRLQRKLKMAEKELEQTEYTLNKELEHLKDQLRSEGSVAMETMQAKMTELQRRHTVALETMEKKHAQDCKRWRLEQVKLANNHVQTQTTNTSHDATDGLQELRSHYLATVNKIKDDVLLHMEKTREQCRETVRKEVIKERHTTAKKLRKYYLQCLQQLLEDDRKGQSNGSGTMLSTANKLAAMASALELSPERTQQTPNGFDFNISNETTRGFEEAIKKTSTAKTEQRQFSSIPQVSDLSSEPHRDLIKHWTSESSLTSFLNTNSDSKFRRSDPTDSRGSVSLGKNSDVNFGSLESLSLSPREFNPMPEKPMSVSPKKVPLSEAMKSSTTRSPYQTDSNNVTVRSRRQYHIKGQSVSSDLQSNDQIYKSNHLSQNNIKLINEKREKPGQAKFVLKQTSTHQTQLPNLLNLSSASLATEYNELPESLDSSLSPNEQKGSGHCDNVRMFTELPRQSRSKVMT